MTLSTTSYAIAADFRNNERLGQPLPPADLDAELSSIKETTATLLEYLQRASDGTSLRAGIIRPYAYEHFDGVVPIASSVLSGITYERFSMLSDRGGVGEIGFVFAGAWDQTTANYTKGQLVVNDGAFYALQGEGHSPSSYASFAAALADGQWMELRPSGKTMTVRRFVATEGQTALPQQAYDPSGVIVLINGAKQVISAFGEVDAFDGVNINFLSYLHEGDIVEVIQFNEPEIVSSISVAPLTFCHSGTIPASTSQLMGAMSFEAPADLGGTFLRVRGVSVADDTGEVTTDMSVRIDIGGVASYTFTGTEIGSVVDDDGLLVVVPANQADLTATYLVEVFVVNDALTSETLHASISLTAE